MIDLGYDASIIISALALALTFLTAIVVPLGRWIAKGWRAPLVAERELRRRVEETLLLKEKECALLEVKLEWCAGKFNQDVRERE